MLYVLPKYERTFFIPLPTPSNPITYVNLVETSAAIKVFKYILVFGIANLTFGMIIRKHTYM